MAVAYAQAGASDIILTSRTSQELESAAEKVKAVSKNVRVSTVSCDVTVEADVESLVRSIKEKHGRLDVLVNNAGYLDAGWQPITEGPADDWKRVLEVNVFGVYLVTRQLLPLLLSSHGGLKTVMGVTSMSSHFAQPSIAMGMSKLSLNRFMEYFADTYREEGLLAYSLHPGGVQTKMSTNPDKVPAGTQESECLNHGSSSSYRWGPLADIVAQCCRTCRSCQQLWQFGLSKNPGPGSVGGMWLRTGTLMS